MKTANDSATDNHDCAGENNEELHEREPRCSTGSKPGRTQSEPCSSDDEIEEHNRRECHDHNE